MCYKKVELINRKILFAKMNQEELIKELKKILKDGKAQKEAAHFLSKIELKESLDSLISSLKENINEEKKINIIQILGDCGQTRESEQDSSIGSNIKVFEVLKEMLRNQNGRIKVAALYALIKTRNPKVIPVLEEAVNIKEIKAAALEGLGEMVCLIKDEEKEKIFDILIKELENEDTKEAAIISLGKIGDKKSVPHLTRLFEKASKDIKKVIAKSLAKIGGEDAQNFLFEMLKKDEEIKEEIIIELEKIYIG